MGAEAHGVSLSAALLLVLIAESWKLNAGG